MKKFYRKLPLPAKLVLIGIIPTIFIIALSIELYIDKSKEVSLIGDYIEKIQESDDLTNLISALQGERRHSYEYSLKKGNHDSVRIKRRITDSTIAILANSTDLALYKFPEYTFIKELPAIRKAMDSVPGYSPKSVVQFYSTAVFRLNTLNSTSPASNVYLKPVYQDLVAQKLLSEMITYLGIIKTNVYNILYTKEYLVEALMGSISTYDVFKTYETEFQLKASPATLNRYQALRHDGALAATLAYIDRFFKTLKPDSTYTAAEWWSISANALRQIRILQTSLWKNAETKMNTIYKRANEIKNQSLILLIAALIIMIAFIGYTIKVISQVLRELKIAAQKISRGSVDIHLVNMPNDVIGKVANSILQINENNKQLAFAAEAIGRGNFHVVVAPRSAEDILGNSIVQMRNDLLQYTMQKDKLQNEALDLVNKKDEFMSIASHELKTPVTSLKAFTQLLQMDAEVEGDRKKKMMFEKMDAQINKLSLLINGLLDTSRVREGAMTYNRQQFDFNKLVEENVEEIQRISGKKQIVLLKNPEVEVYADRERIGQVINNLISNAVKYSKGSDIKVSVTLTGSRLVCSVADKGIGISKNEQLKIFDRFYRVSGHDLHTYPGLGLGLYISKEIIQRHDGQIWVESEPGGETIFYFSLPIHNNGNETL